MEHLTGEDYAVALQHGIQKGTAYYRYQYLFWSKEEAITLTSKALWSKYAHLCEAHGVSQWTFYHRIRERQMSPEEAATTPLNKRGGARYKGFVFTDEMLETMKKHGISRATAYQRHKVLGWDLERSLTQPTSKFSPEVVETAKKNGISKAALYNRVTNLRWSVERAMTEPVKKYKNERFNV